MIRIYQKEKEEKKSKEVIYDDLVEKNIKIASVMIRATPINGNFNWIYDCWIYFFSGKLIAAGELRSK